MEYTGDRRRLDIQAEQDDKLQDECGVFGVYAPGEPVALLTYQGLRGLQHRGQSGAGIAVADMTSSYCQAPEVGMPLIVHKNTGLVDEAIHTEVYPLPEQGTSRLDLSYHSSVAIGHVRYSTAERNDPAATQPFVGKLTGIAVAHNGHIDDMERVAGLYGIPSDGTVSDSALLTRVLDQRTALHGRLETALHEVLTEINGAYCLTITDGDRVVAARDPWGFHPLALGALPEDKGFMVASEPVVFGELGGTYERDIEPGEVVVLDAQGVTSSRLERQEPVRRCMFEYVYTARPEGRIDGVSVYRARKNLGRYLAEDYPAVDADVVVGVPNSGLAAAAGYAETSGLPRVDGILKNPYIGRTFIERGAKRKQTLAEKFHMNSDELLGRRLVLVDDSLIKGNTMKQLVSMLRGAGAAAVHVRLSAPRYENPCLMGMDTHDVGLLIARAYGNEEIAAIIGADSVAFNDVGRVEQAIDEASVDPRIKRGLGSFCTACATGTYPFPVEPELVGLGMPRARRA